MGQHQNGSKIDPRASFGELIPRLEPEFRAGSIGRGPGARNGSWFSNSSDFRGRCGVRACVRACVCARACRRGCGSHSLDRQLSPYIVHLRKNNHQPEMMPNTSFSKPFGGNEMRKQQFRCLLGKVGARKGHTGQLKGHIKGM